MAEQTRANPTGHKVSPARTIVSLVLLLIVGVVCIIELRAGLGQMMTGKAMAAKAEDGAFSGVSLEEAKGMLSLAPTESIHREDESETVYRYEWFSLLRPLMGESSPQVFIVASRGEPPMAQTFYTSAEEDPAPVASSSNRQMPGEMPAGMPGMGGGMPGMGGGMPGMGGGMPGMGGGRGPGGGRNRPPLEEEASDEKSDAPADTPDADAPAESKPEEPAETKPEADSATDDNDADAPKTSETPAAESAPPKE